MEAKDLMIGDWVYNTHNRQNEQVAEIGSGLVMLEYNDLYEYDEIEPIPLTPEILEKNEFKKFDFLHIEGQYQWTWWENTLISATLWCRELNNDTKDGMVLKIEAPNFSLCLKVNYVHELQHALILCGIEKEIEL